MRREPQAEPKPNDVVLDHGCILCGGPLSMRVGPGSAVTYCAECHWISRPLVHRHHDELHLVHTAGMRA
jgi:hypothetical protein